MQIIARTSVGPVFFGYLSHMTFYRNNKVIVGVVIYSKILIAEVCISFNFNMPSFF